MKALVTLAFGIALTQGLSAQSLVNGTNYAGLFGPADDVTVNPPVNGGIIASLAVGGTTGTQSLGTYWTANATGGVSLGALGIPVATSGAQVALTGSALQFNVENGGLVGDLLDAGLTGLSTTWTATATFDAAGQELLLQPNETYRLSFDVDGSNGLLNSTLGILPNFSVQFLDGAGNVVGDASSATLINIVGLLGTGVESGNVTIDFVTGSGVNTTGAASVRFNGGATLNATALGLGTNFATVSNLSITQVPEPSAALLGAVGMLAMLRRRRN